MHRSVRVRTRKHNLRNPHHHTRQGGTSPHVHTFVDRFIAGVRDFASSAPTPTHHTGGNYQYTRTSSKKVRVEDVRAMNLSRKLRSQLFNEHHYPTDFALVKMNKDILPAHLSSKEDYAHWLALKPHLTDDGKQRLKRLRDFAKEEFPKDDIDGVLPASVRIVPPPAPPQASASTTYVPPHTTDEPEDAPASSQPHHDDAEEKADGGPPSTPAVSQEAEPVTYAESMRLAQLKHSDKEKHHYEQMALKEADQRQLLMLLCGDVEADMFFDEEGELRGPRQIIEQVLFLLKPYHMSNSKQGVWARHIYFYTNYVWKYGTSVAMLVVSVMTMYHLGLFMMMCTRTLSETDAYSNIIKGFLNKSAFIFIGLFNTIVSVISRHLRVPNHGTSFNGRVGRDITRMLCIGGPPAMLWWFFTCSKVDYSSNEQLSLAMYCVRTLHDRHKQLDAMNYLAQLTPGFFGEDMSSGITNGQLGMICCMQDELLKLDKKVDELTEDVYAKINAKYNKGGRGTGITEHKLRLANMLNREFNTALKAPVDAHTQSKLVAFRKELLSTYTDDMRCFHFLDAYGHPRDIVGICKAYFIYWQMCEQSQRLPTIPYEGKGTFAEQLKLTPLQQLRTKRKKMKASQNIPKTWWRQHPFLYKNNKTPIHLQETLCTEPASAISLFDHSNQQAIRKHKGWTHRISQIGEKNAIDRFHLNVMMLSKEYDLVKRKESGERRRQLELRESTPTTNWNDDRHLNVFEGGTKLQAPDTPKALTASQKPSGK